jgi:short-subunit dehydrogenase involved in D-alanine esterification of teichoic acids
VVVLLLLEGSVARRAVLVLYMYKCTQAAVSAMCAALREHVTAICVMVLTLIVSLSILLN